MKRVAVLRGGPSAEYPVSMETGKAVLAALKNLPYSHKDVVITRQGEWLDDGKIRRPEMALEGVDVVFVALHGEYGEDGQVQRIMERLNIPFTGSNSLSSAIAFNKELAKQTVRGHNINMPRHRRFARSELDTLSDEVDSILKEIGTELFIKPIANGSSVGAAHVGSREALLETLPNILAQHEQVLIEEFIRGKEATVGVLHDYRGESRYVLPVIEVIPPRTDTFYTFANKYDGTTEHVCPGRFSYKEKAELQEAARIAHDALGCSHYSRSDFMLRDGEIYYLETNTLPGFTSESNFPIAAAAVGLEFPQLVRHLVETAKV